MASRSVRRRPAGRDHEAARNSRARRCDLYCCILPCVQPSAGRYEQHAAKLHGDAVDSMDVPNRIVVFGFRATGYHDEILTLASVVAEPHNQEVHSRVMGLRIEDINASSRRRSV